MSYSFFKYVKVDKPYLLFFFKIALYAMEVTHNGAVHFEINRDSKKIFVLDSVDNLITFEDWHHLAITYDLIKNKVLFESTF